MNLGNPHEFTMNELAVEVLDLTGSASRVVYRPLPEDDPRVRCPDIAKARELLGFEPKVLLREGLARTMAYFRDVATRDQRRVERRHANGHASAAAVAVAEPVRPRVAVGD